MIENNRYYWSHLKTKTVTVRVMPKKQPKGVIFRVGNMIDLGHGRQTVMLDHVDYPKASAVQQCNKDVAVPFRMGHLDFVYTSRRKPMVRNVQSLLDTLYKGSAVEKIVTDVLSPGDLLVFHQDQGNVDMERVETLRVVNDQRYKRFKSKA